MVLRSNEYSPVDMARHRGYGIRQTHKLRNLRSDPLLHSPCLPASTCVQELCVVSSLKMGSAVCDGDGDVNGPS